MNHVALSSDGLYLAVSDCTDGVYVYELDRVRLYWKLPSCGASVTCISFAPNVSSQLVILLAEGILAYDVDSMTLTPWAEENQKRITGVLNKVSSPLHGISFDPAHTSRLYLYGQGVCMHVDMSATVPKKAKVANPFLVLDMPVDGAVEETPRKGKKSRASSGAESSNFSSVFAYRSVIDIGSLENQLVST